MNKINLARVLLGGLMAGIALNFGETLLNEIVLGEQRAAEVMNAKSESFQIETVTARTLLNFLLGIILVWIYAAFRPRFGPGPKTAIFVGLTIWTVQTVLWLLFAVSFFQVATDHYVVLNYETVIWGLFELPIAAIAGAWLYRE